MVNMMQLAFKIALKKKWSYKHREAYVKLLEASYNPTGFIATLQVFSKEDEYVKDIADVVFEYLHQFSNSQLIDVFFLHNLIENIMTALNTLIPKKEV